MLAEHQAGNGEAGLGPGPAGRIDSLGLVPPQDQLDALEADPFRALEQLRVVCARQDVAHHPRSSCHRATGRRPPLLSGTLRA